MSIEEQIEIVESNIAEYGVCDITIEEYRHLRQKIRADAIEEYHLKLLNCQTNKVKSIHDAEIWVEFKRQSTRIAEELREQK